MENDTRVCRHCGISIAGTYHKRRFCSVSCRSKDFNANYVASPPDSKPCKRCCTVKPIDEFYLRPGVPDGHQSHCKVCASEMAKGRDLKSHPSRQPQRTRERRVKWMYGITQDQYLAMVESQHGRCAICGDVEELVIDHCHTSKQVRGLLCQRCNKGIGLLRDDQAIMAAAIAYLRRN